ncbi:MAG TPA: glycosyltransferase family A protein [Terriglobales bacterium]|nr:glycosyltransferase family A protein [Terriglobales bacterium]
MTSRSKHITVCVCTYRRPEMLKSLLEDLRGQNTGGLFTYSILVVDNDHRRSANDVVTEFAARHAIEVEYYVEPEQNIALARNKAIEHAQGDFVVFIDDDESPIQRWLLTLFEVCTLYNVHGVLGPVHPRFSETPPAWVIAGKFYDRPTYPTGFVIDWRKGRTGNTLLKREVFAGVMQPFRPEFRTGEDQDFFRRVIEKGYVFIWCDEAVAFEVVPPTRWSRAFMLKRALLRGYTSLAHPTFAARDILTSAMAAPAYALALPFALALGQGTFMSVLVRLFDHLGRLLGFVGINPIKEPYVTT